MSGSARARARSAHRDAAEYADAATVTDPDADRADRDARASGNRNTDRDARAIQDADTEFSIDQHARQQPDAFAHRNAYCDGDDHANRDADAVAAARAAPMIFIGRGQPPRAWFDDSEKFAYTVGNAGAWRSW